MKKDNKCFQWSIISWLNYNKIKKYIIEKIENLKGVDIHLLSHQRDWKKFEQNNTSIALNVLFVSYNSEEIKLVYKSRYTNNFKNHVILLINDETKNLLFCCKKLVRIKFFRVVKS